MAFILCIEKGYPMTNEQLQQMIKKSKKRIDNNVQQAKHISQEVKEIIERLNIML